MKTSLAVCPHCGRFFAYRSASGKPYLHCPHCGRVLRRRAAPKMPRAEFLRIRRSRTGLYFLCGGKLLNFCGRRRKGFTQYHR